MKVGLVPLMAIAGILGIATPALADADMLDQSGNAFLQNCADQTPGYHPVECSTYVLGFNEGIDVSQQAEAFGVKLCIPKQATAGQLTDVILAYIESHPADRHQPTKLLAYYALGQAYHCATGK
ncbi:MAG: hypothetical protein NVS3B5_04890 [Sphingomicrobium sp.]